MKRYGIVATKRYRKDYKRLLKSGVDILKLEQVIDKIAGGQTLPVTCFDHALRGELAGSRECHIGPDWLLRYTKIEDRLLLLLLSTGDHRHVLGIE